MKLIKSMTGYKGTTKDMTCQGFKFELGKWYEHEGELNLCQSGFHFCKYPSGPWAYYSDTDTRIFRVEAEDVLDLPSEPGADYKLVCRKIRLVEEVKIGGEKNTGHRNTGHRNTGDSNTGHGNVGNFHTGFFSIKPAKVISFDVQTKYTREQFNARYQNLVDDLLSALSQEAPIAYSRFKKLPGITKAKLEKLHKAHLDARKAKP